MDKACIGEGATHNACPCFLERMGKLERVRVAAEQVIYLLGRDGESVVPHLIDTDDNAGQQLREALTALRETEEK